MLLVVSLPGALRADGNPVASDIKDALAPSPVAGTAGTGRMNRVPSDSRTALAAARGIPGPKAVYRDAAAPIEERVADLLRRMTLEEKLGQLQQLGAEENGDVARLAQLARDGRLGGTLGAFGAEKFNEIQRAALQSRLAIPVLFGFDVIHGYRTIFPIPLGLSSSWDPSIVEEAASVSAAEAAAAGIRWTYSPMVDIARDPRWGRIAEGAGEDPFLGAAMARAWVRGYQGADPSAPGKLAACVKHWVAYGAAEGGRDYNTTEVSERTLREIYFQPFKAAVDAGALTVMSAFNDVDGVPASANPFTLTKVLRGEWGFKGFVVSDYESVKELIAHGFAADERDAALRALPAGVDMEMVSRSFARFVPELLRERKLPQSAVDEAVRRVLRVKFKLGLFERPYVDASKEAPSMLTPDSRAAARRIAGRSLVLLKNNGGTLPFSKNVRRVAVIGALAGDPEAILGTWRGEGRPEDAVTLLDALKAKLPQAEILFAHTAKEAVAAAKRADVVIVALGETADQSGEAASRSSLDLPAEQLALAKAAFESGRPAAVVLLNGRPLTISWLAENAPALLEAWHPGVEGGNAVADALFGDVNPGGKLTASFPRSVGQIPIYYDHKSTGRPASAAKFTSKYLDLPSTPLYPFGYGLSYTTFRLSNLRVSADRISPRGSLRVSIDVENTGSREGDEVAQLYVHRPVASVTRPVLELKGFTRVTLAPGEKRTVTLTLGPAELGLWGAGMRWSVEPGPVELLVGTSSAGGLRARFDIRPR